MVYEGYVVLGVAFSVAIMLLDIYLLKLHRVSSGTFARWFIIALAAGIVSLIPAILTVFTVFLGTQFVISAAALTSFLFLLLLIFYLDYRLGSIEGRLTILVANIASTQYASKRRDDSRDHDKDDRK